MSNKPFTLEERIVGLGLHPIPPTVKYIGLFFSTLEKQWLTDRIAPCFPEVYADHVTLLYAPSAAAIDAWAPYRGKYASAVVREERHNTRCQALVVHHLLVQAAFSRDTHPTGEFIKKDLHVTLSCETYTEPAYANLLMQDQSSATHKHSTDFGLKGEIGFMLNDGTIDFGGPAAQLTFSRDEIEKFLVKLDLALMPDPE